MVGRLARPKLRSHAIVNDVVMRRVGAVLP